MEIAISAGMDILLIAVFIICIVIGFAKGFVKSLVSLVGNFIALIVAFSFCASFGSYLNTNYIREPIQQWFINAVTTVPEGTDAALEDVNMDSLFSDSPQFFLDAAEFLGVDLSEMSAKYEDLKVNGAEQAKSAIINAMTNPLSETVSRVVAFLIIYIGCMIAISILWLVAEMVTKIPGIKQLDKLGGLLLGVVNGLIFVFVLSSVLNFTMTVFLNGHTYSDKQKMVENTMIYKHVEQLNPLNKIFRGQ